MDKDEYIEDSIDLNLPYRNVYDISEDDEDEDSTEDGDDSCDFTPNGTLTGKGKTFPKKKRGRPAKKKAERVAKKPEFRDELTLVDSCSGNPNFAVITDFISKFGEQLGLRSLAMGELERMLETQTGETVPADLVHLHTVLLRRIALPKKITITKWTWEKGLNLYCRFDLDIFVINSRY